MIFKSKYFLKDQLGEFRVRWKFLLYPRHFGSSKTWKWMCQAPVIEQVLEVDVGGSGQWGCYAYKWCEVGFAPDDMARIEADKKELKQGAL